MSKLIVQPSSASDSSRNLSCQAEIRRASIDARLFLVPRFSVLFGGRNSVSPDSWLWSGPQGQGAAVALTSDGTAGDALDDAFFVLGPDGSRNYLSQLPGTEVFFFLPDAAHGWT